MTASLDPPSGPEPDTPPVAVVTSDNGSSHQSLVWLVWLSLLVILAAVFIFIAWNNGIPARP